MHLPTYLHTLRNIQKAHRSTRHVYQVHENILYNINRENIIITTHNDTFEIDERVYYNRIVFLTKNPLTSKDFKETVEKRRFFYHHRATNLCVSYEQRIIISQRGILQNKVGSEKRLIRYNNNSVLYYYFICVPSKQRRL